LFAVFDNENLSAGPRHFMSFFSLFFVVAIAMLVVVAAMAVGVAFGRKPISGSCGGLGNQQQAGSCSLCSNRDTCADAKANQSLESGSEVSSDQTVSPRI
jgi:hypothetical protein